MAEVIAENSRRRWSRCPSQVLPEYREYERAMTTLVDAAVKPTVAAYVSGIARRLAALDGGAADPVLDHAVQRRRAVRGRGRPPADQHRAVRAGGRRAGRRGDRRRAGFRSVRDLRRRRHVDRRHGDHRRATVADHRGVGRPVSGEDPDDRRGDRRRRRRIDRLALGGGHAQGRTAVGRRGSRARPATGWAAPNRPSPTRTWCWAGSRRTCSAARSRWTPRRRPPRSARWPVRSG